MWGISDLRRVWSLKQNFVSGVVRKQGLHQREYEELKHRGKTVYILHTRKMKNLNETSKM